jgi:hypothetical protein
MYLSYSIDKIHQLKESKSELFFMKKIGGVLNQHIVPKKNEGTKIERLNLDGDGVLYIVSMIRSGQYH